MISRARHLKNTQFYLRNNCLKSSAMLTLYRGKMATYSTQFLAGKVQRNYSSNAGNSSKYPESFEADESDFSLVDTTNTERLLDFESRLHSISSSLLTNSNGEKLSQDELNQYWKDLIVEYETSCNVFDPECNSMDLIVLRQYLNMGLRTNVFSLRYSDMLSKFIHLLTIVKAGTSRDYAIALNDLKLRQNKDVTQTMNQRVETRLISIFKELLKFLEFVPLKRDTQDISINFFYIIFLRLLSENEQKLSQSSKNSDIKLKLLNFFRSEMSKKKTILQPQPTPENSFLRQLQTNNFNSLSIDEEINAWDMDSIRALQKCMIYRVIRTQDPEVISNFWDNFNFRSVFYKNNILESWFVFVEQMEVVFKKENVEMTPYMRNYIRNELLVTLEHDLISISEIRIKKGQILLAKLKQFAE